MAGEASLSDRSTVRRALQELVASGVLTCYSGGSEPVWGSSPTSTWWRRCTATALSTCWSNGRSLARAGGRGGSEAGPGRKAWDEALRLRELLKFDFLLSRASSPTTSTEPAPIDPDGGEVGAEVSPDDAQRWLERLRPHVAHLELRPFLDAYSVVAEQLTAADASEEFDEQQFLAGCLRVGRQWALQRLLASEESVSAEMFRTALQLARHRGLPRS